MTERDDMQAWIHDAAESLGRRVEAASAEPHFTEVLRRSSDLGAVESAEVELTGFVADAREGLDRLIDAAPQAATFSDAMARAHALHPELIDAAKLADARRLAPVVDLRRHSAGERALEAFVGDARAGVEARIDARTRARLGASAADGHAAEGAKAGRGMVAAVIAVAVAAVVAAFVVGPDVLQRADDGRVGADAEQAELIEAREDGLGEAAHVQPEAKPEPRAPAERVVVETHPPEEPPPERQTTRRRAPSEPEPSLADLAALAKTQWRGGDLAAAETTLRRIVERGGTSRWADNAYSDLFALAHRRGDGEARQRWWRAYLRRFPRGQFADDAQAGLCRASSKRRACWADYLERFPDGSYRVEARRMVDGG